MFIRIPILIWDTHSLGPMVTIFYGYQIFKACDKGDAVKESVEFDVGHNLKSREWVVKNYFRSWDMGKVYYFRTQ